MAQRRRIRDDMVADKSRKTYWADNPSIEAEIYEEHKKKAVHVFSAPSRLEYQKISKEENEIMEEINYESDDGGYY